MIGRLSRGPGRHREGRPRTAVHRRLWDGPARSEAERLDRQWPGWLVLYSLGERRFHAIASWPAPEPLTVSDDTAEGLERRVREAEAALARQRPSTPPHPPSDPSPHPSSGRSGSPGGRGDTTSRVSAVMPWHGRRPYRNAA
ncbi:hypothetical protein [Streptosporangium sp. NPDC051022]|uniref:hypothetical protein n=1 Tax=Streptosporangium sp. NPDC051022 TaxID=3155752 RepID=UPI0034464B68